MAELVDFGNGFSAYTRAESEARFIHHEIFNDGCYDIAKFPENPFFVDAGANIGFFSLYMKRKYPSARILAFEPAPATYDVLRKNIELHQADVQAHQTALGSENTTDTLTFYPMVPGNSTFVPEEKETMKKLVPDDAKELVTQALSHSEQVEVPIKRLSEFLGGDNEGRDIDLLKIDVEARELDVCKGLDDEHWARVRNVAIEIFDLHGALDEMTHFLESKGLSVTKELAIKNQKEEAKAKVWLVVGQRT